MNVDFVTEDQIAELSDDPRRAFIEFTNIAAGVLDEMLRMCRDNDDQEGAEEVRYSYQSIILAAARKFGIEPFSQMDLPRIDQLQQDRFKQFVADLHHYRMQIRLGLAEQDRGDSIPLPEKSTASIRSHVSELREAIDRDLNLTEATKARLHKRLTEFEEELNRKRIRLWAVARIIFEILAVPGAINESRAALQDFASFVMREIGEAKVAENENRQVPYHEPLALLPPRKGEISTQGLTEQELQLEERRKLDDEIPF